MWRVDANNSPQPDTPPAGVDRELARVAARQHGIVTRRQLVGVGLDAGQIAYRVRVGRLLPVHRGVYAVGHIPPSPHARAMAAVLACGPRAVLSHRSAAALWGLIRWRGAVEVTTRGNRSHRGVTVHRSRTLTEADLTTHYGMAVTTPARTLLDLADVLDAGSLTRAVNDARLQRLLTVDDLAAQIAASPGRATSHLAAHLDHPTAPTRSAFEDAFLAFIERHGLPRPEVNQQVAGHEVDMLWRDRRLIAELDGRAYHDAAFEDDRERDADLVAAGFRVVRVTWARLTRQPDREAARFRVLLA